MAAKNEPPGRREALKKLVSLGGLSAASAGLAVWLNGRSRRPVEGEASNVAPRAAIPPDPNISELVIARARPGGQGDDAPALVRAALEELGGIKRFVAEGETVLVKPNIGWDRTPEQAANTNPEVVAEVVRLCREARAAHVIVTDVSCNDPRRCFSRSGIAEAAAGAGAEVILPDERVLKRAHLPGSLGSWQVLEPLLAADKVINIPVAKHHSLPGVTLGFKNWLGIVSGPRYWLHQDIHSSVVDLAELARPALTIIDAYRILIRNGPTGGSLSDVELKKTVIAATDPVAADAYAAKEFWNLDARVLPYLRIAQDRGLGKMEFEKVRSKTLDV